jgi:hypothetical protein
MFVIPALRKPMQKDSNFQVILVYTGFVGLYPTKEDPFSEFQKNKKKQEEEHNE